MKVKVVSGFRDKNTHEVYAPGDVIEVDEARRKELGGRVTEDLSEDEEGPEKKAVDITTEKAKQSHTPKKRRK